MFQRTYGSPFKTRVFAVSRCDGTSADLDLRSRILSIPLQRKDKRVFVCKQPSLATELLQSPAEASLPRVRKLPTLLPHSYRGHLPGKHARWEEGFQAAIISLPCEIDRVAIFAQARRSRMLVFPIARLLAIAERDLQGVEAGLTSVAKQLPIHLAFRDLQPCRQRTRRLAIHGFNQAAHTPASPGAP